MGKRVAFVISVFALALVWQIRMEKSTPELGGHKKLGSTLLRSTSRNSPPHALSSQTETAASSRKPAAQTHAQAQTPFAQAPVAHAQAIKNLNRKFRKQRQRPPQKRPRETFRGLERGAKQSISGHDYQALAAKAIPAQDYRPDMGSVLSRVGDYVIVAAPANISEDFSKLYLGSSDRPVVLNLANGAPAIVTGTIKVQLIDTAQAQVLAAAQGLKLLAVDQDLKVAFLRAPQEFSLTDAVNRLKGVAGVLRVDLDLFQSRVVGK
jgi:hypothetical protein